jgi:hypothetical protein
MLLDARASVGQGARRRCAVCGFPIKIKTTGRTAKFCSAACRDTARRKANFAISGHARYGGSGVPRNPDFSPTKSNTCKADLADRASAIKARIVAIGRGVSVGPQPAEVSAERAQLIRRAMKLEFAARWRSRA